MKKDSIRLPVHISPKYYQIILRPNLENFTFTGEEIIDLKIDQKTKEITLHANELEIISAIILGSEKEIAVDKIILDKLKETVTLKFSQNIVGQKKLKINFTGILNDKMRGFYRSKFMLDGQDVYLATTQFESTDARKAFPCFDEPSQKAIFDVTLMVPAHLTVISNTIEAQVWEHEAGIKAVKFLPTPKMSTYLLAFVVGQFDFLEGKTKRGVKVRVFTTPGKSKQGKFALNCATKILDFYEDYFDISYPLPVLDLIAIPDFAAGAMENWGAVTYRETALLIDPENSALSAKQRVAIVVAHELAHQWFGNLVTMEWWTHLWLNEGFASYIEYLAVDYLFPEWDMWTQFLFEDQGTALSLDGLKNTHPIEVEVKDPKEISEIFDAVSYSKGASIIRMLAEYLGPKTFRDGLRHYLKKHSYSNAKTEDLWISFEHVAKKPVVSIMNNWTAKAGYPLLKIKERGDKLLIYQSRFFQSPISKKQIQDKTIWQIPLNVKSSGEGRQYLMTEKTLTLPQNSSLLKLNSGEGSFLRVNYPQHFLNGFKKDIQENKMDVLGRLSLIRDVFALSESGDLPTIKALILSLSYKKEDNYSVWVELAANLGQVSSLIAQEKFYHQFEKYAREIFSAIFPKMGWQKKKKEKHTDTLLRSLVLYHLGSYGNEEIIKTAQKMWQDHQNNKIEADLRGVVYNLVAENGSAKEWNELKMMYQEESLQEEKNRVSRAMALFKDKKLLQKTLQFAISSDVRSQDAVNVIAQVANNPQGLNLTWAFIAKNWPILQKRYAGMHFMFSRLIKSLSNFSKIKFAKEIENFFAKNPVPEAKRSLAQTLEQIYSNAAWLDRDKQKIKHFLQDYS